MLSWGLSIYINTKLETTWSYIIYNFFEKKKRSETSLPV